MDEHRRSDDATDDETDVADAKVSDLFEFALKLKQVNERHSAERHYCSSTRDSKVMGRCRVIGPIRN